MIAAIGLILILNPHIEKADKIKNIHVGGYTIIENIFDYGIEVNCSVSSSDFCYAGDFGNCEGKITYEPVSNLVNSNENNDIAFRGYGDCTIKYQKKILKFGR